VPVYVERIALASRRPIDVAYVPIDRTGTFQPYVGYFGNGCD
jgi:hypothetical protein